MKIVKNLIKFLYKTSEFNPLRKFLNQYKNNSIIFCLHSFAKEAKNKRGSKI